MTGFLAGLVYTVLEYRKRTGEILAPLALYAFGFVLSVLFARFLHWYSSATTYNSLKQALTDYSVGSFNGSGIVIGACLAGTIVGAMGLCRKKEVLMDCAAPGFALMMVFVRLSAWGTGKCQGGKNLQSGLLQHFPLSVKGTDSAGNVYYRFATFLIGAICYLAVFFIMRSLYAKSLGTRMKKPAKRYGNVWKMMLLAYAGIEIVLDSTRIDSMHFTFRKILTLNRFSTFISIGQVVPAVIFVSLFVYYCKCSSRARGFSLKHIISIVLLVGGLVLIGFLGEYKWQRIGSYMSYLYMTVGSLLLVGVIRFLYRDCIRRGRPRNQ